MTRRLRRPALAVAIAAVLIAAYTSEGAYFSQSWGWLALAFLMPTTLLVIVERAVLPGSFRAAFVIAMTSFAAWIALSTTWSISVSGSVREVERLVVYLAVAVAIAFAVRRGDIPAVQAGVLTAVTVVSA